MFVLTYDQIRSGVRPVVWYDDQFPGFGGTCFIVRLLGRTVAATARHVLGPKMVRGSPGPSNIAIPNSLTGWARDSWMRPTDGFFYNVSEELDHLSDVAVLCLPTAPPGCFELPLADFIASAHSEAGSTESSEDELNPGEFLMAYGFPNCRSQVAYNVPKELRKRGITCIFHWREAVFFALAGEDAAKRSKLCSFNLLTDAEFGPVDFELNGMSGSPIFRGKEEGDEIKWTFAGIVVRGSSESGRGYFIRAPHVCVHLFQVAMKDPALRAELVDKLPPAALVKSQAETLVRLAGGNKDLALSAFQTAQSFKEALHTIAVHRFENDREGFEKQYGEESVAMMVEGMKRRGWKPPI